MTFFSKKRDFVIGCNSLELLMKRDRVKNIEKEIVVQRENMKIDSWWDWIREIGRKKFDELVFFLPP